ncbi:aminoacyl-tRNA hydrolase, partial [Escherichia coli]|nr:aminoacyl-tRNA hydrolase [Escherichia coli]
NGLKSISQSTGSKDYIRLRFGIGRPPGRQDPSDFVLRPFSSTERKELDVLIAQAADAVEDVLRNGLESATMRLHTKH